MLAGGPDIRGKPTSPFDVPFRSARFSYGGQRDGQIDPESRLRAGERRIKVSQRVVEDVDRLCVSEAGQGMTTPASKMRVFEEQERQGGVDRIGG